MYNVEFSTDFESSAAAPTVADRWKSAHWCSAVAASGDAGSGAIGVTGCLAFMLSILPPAPEGRRAVFHSRRSSECR